jgi:glycosyltransferase involved in cell wall biosynthesis
MTDRLRILQVAPRYAPAWAFGGGVRMTFELARVWARDGHEVSVFTSDQESAERRFADISAEIDGIRVRRFRNRSHALAARYPFLFFRPQGLAGALRDVRSAFDVVHVAESRGPHNRWVAREVAAQNVPIVWSAYGGLAAGEGLRRLYRRVHDEVFNTRAIVQRCAALIAQTAHEAEIYEQFGATPERIHLIPLGVNWRDFEQVPTRGSFRQRLGLGMEDPLVLFLGRVHWTKGLQVLIPAFASLARAVPTARLAVVGWDHGYLGPARRLVAELGLDRHVMFAGPLYGNERFGAYVDADLFALTPGVFEETSLAALEACASGTGCVITRQCEIPGLDAAGGGRTVEYAVDSVAQALEEGLRDRAAVRWGRNARQLVQHRFTIERVARSHVELFNTIVHPATSQAAAR